MATETPSKLPPRAFRVSRLRLDAPVIGLTAIACLVMLFRLGTKDLTTDEMASSDYARMSFANLWHVITHTDPNMGLYYVVLHFWTHVFGSGAVAVRSMSVLLSCVAVPLFVALGTRLFGRSTGLIAGLLLALNPFFVEYAQSARSYGVLVTLIIASTLLFLRALEDPSTGRIGGYVGISAVAVYAHYFALLVLFVHACTLIAIDRRNASSRSWQLAAGALALICIPDLAVAAGRSVNLDWVPKPTVSNLIHLPSLLFGGEAAVLLATVGAYFVVTAWRSSQAQMTRMLTAWATFPVASVFVESRLATTSLFVPRYLIIVIPPIILLASAGIAKLGSTRSRLAAATVAVVIAISLAVPLHRWFAAGSQNTYRVAMSYLASHFRSADAISVGYTGSIRPGTVAVAGWSNWGLDYYWAVYGREPLNIVSARALTRSSSTLPRRVWLVLNTSITRLNQVPPTLRSDLAVHYSAVRLPMSINSFPTVILYTMRAPRSTR